MRVVAALCSVAIAFAAPSALACYNGMRLNQLERTENLVAKASAAYRDGKYGEAVKLTESTLKLDGLSATDRRALLRTHGLASLKLGHFQQSVTSFGALNAEKKEPFVQAKLAEAQLRGGLVAGDGDGAAKAALEKLAADGLLADADAWTALALGRLKDGDPAGAKAACDEALKVQPEHPEATQVLAGLMPKVKPSAGPTAQSPKS
ncbi:MAG: hypothetical protein IAE78_08180 [Myxococcus sp.]|nr:hypothetical protein [Myxococcus sp.]